MTRAARDLVRQRASECCEYCRLHQDDSPFTHHIEHIVAKQHGGSDQQDNLAMACHRCNLQKGPNLTGIDPETSEVVLLFHPRIDSWDEHFRFRGAILEGLTATGRATIETLTINDNRRVELREQLPGFRK